MPALDPSSPFVLLDDAREHGAPAHARLFTRPHAVIRADKPEEVAPALAAMRQAQADGLHLAGYMAYDAGLEMEARTRTLHQPGADAPVRAPLVWIGAFDSMERIAPRDVPALLPDPAGAWIGPVQPMISRDDYQRMFDRIQSLIAAGDIYQANLTFQSLVTVEGAPLAAYARLRRATRAGWGGVIHTGEHWLLSVSPELFFTIDNGDVTARPMKGTAPRGRDQQADRAEVEALRSDAKQRAENLMIVDLIRNDLSRLAVPGSVKTTSLFDVETYPNIHQLTSTVTARLAEGRGPIDAIEALFPCGSITGAPKIRAMEIIAEVEHAPRGIYTGTIGWIDPAGNAGFNVVIRTLVMRQGEPQAVLGLGSGLVADSKANDEWAECLAKGAFVTSGNAPFDLIETMRFDPVHGLEHLDLHIARLERSAHAFGFRFDRHAARNELQAAVFMQRNAAKVRLLLGPSGAIAIETAPLPPLPAGPVAVSLAPLPVAPDDFRLRHKTTDRRFHDDARKRAGTFEVLFTHGDGLLSEGSFTSVFVERDGKLLTPPLTAGLLPGVLRESLLRDGRAVEADLRVADLNNGFFIGNALRGLIPATLVASTKRAAL